VCIEMPKTATQQDSRQLFLSTQHHMRAWANSTDGITNQKETEESMDHQSRKLNRDRTQARLKTTHSP
jgi:hypothetical protein